MHDGAPRLIRGTFLLRWTPSGYIDPVPRPRGGRAVVITPPSSVEVLRHGWQPVVPLFHPSASAVATGIR